MQNFGRENFDDSTCIRQISSDFSTVKVLRYTVVLLDIVATDFMIGIIFALWKMKQPVASGGLHPPNPSSITQINSSFYKCLVVLETTQQKWTTKHFALWHMAT